MTQSKNEEIKRSLLLLSLLPEYTLSTVAKVYGLSRERVRQITTKELGIPVTKLKDYLRDISPLFKCQSCGKTLPSERSRYCSSKCKAFGKNYLTRCVICKNCKQSYRPLRIYAKNRGGTFCSLKCRKEYERK